MRLNYFGKVDFSQVQRVQRGRLQFAVLTGSGEKLRSKAAKFHIPLVEVLMILMGSLLINIHSETK